MKVAVPFQKIMFRPGIGNFPNWSSMNKEAAPSNVAANQFVLLRNTRFDDTDVKARGGQTKFNSSSVSSSVVGIYDTVEEEDFGNKLWGFGYGTS
jgi:hypothetical protein